MSGHTLTERLAEIRDRATAPAGPPRPRRPPPEDRAAALARWFGAQLAVASGGTAVLVERRVPLPASVRETLATLPAASYFDTETTGLSTGAGTVVFLAGIGWVEGDRFVARQILLPDYPHEAAVLRRVTSDLAARDRLVTYNGRGFDLPLLTARLTVNGLFRELADLPATHDDLLPVARRLWRRPLGGARLAIIERHVLGVERPSDCPSSEVPTRYFSYLRGGSPDLLADVLDHNLQDIVSLALLEAEIWRLRRGAWRAVPGPLDRRGMALELLRGGSVDDALATLHDGLLGMNESAEAAALRRLASRLLLSRGEIDLAEQMWTSATRRASLDAATAWIEVARIRERHRHDLVGALHAAEAASRILDLAFALGRGGEMQAIGAVRLRVDARRRRLRKWVTARERRHAQVA